MLCDTLIKYPQDYIRKDSPLYLLHIAESDKDGTREGINEVSQPSFRIRLFYFLTINRHKMSEKQNLPIPTSVTVTAQFNIAFTQHGISVQKIQDEINSLEFTEDNLPRISELIKSIKGADKVIEAKHKEGKAPYLEGGKVWDEAKKSLLTINEGLLNQLTPKYNQLCAAIEQRQKEAENEKNRINAIKAGIESNLISFSSRIAQCQTNAELLAIERVINLEKSDSRKSKYMEFHDEAIEKYDSVLLPILKDQKEKISRKKNLKNRF